MWAKEVIRYILGERQDIPNLGEELPEVEKPIFYDDDHDCRAKYGEDSCRHPSHIPYEG